MRHLNLDKGSPASKSVACAERFRSHGFRWIIALPAVLAISCMESVPVPSPDQAAPAPNLASTRARDASGADHAEFPVAINIANPRFPARTRDGDITGVAISPKTTLDEAYRSRLVDEIKLYPKTLLKRIKLIQIVLCENLAFSGTKCLSFADVEHGSIYLDVQLGRFDENVRWTIHHEIFHQIDYAGDAMLDPDPAWESLNPVGFRYTQDVERLQSLPDEARREVTVKGFLNRYAMASPTEDKAELYACLVVEPVEATHRLNGDDVLQRKAAKIREMIDAFGAYSTILIGR